MNSERGENPGLVSILSRGWSMYKNSQITEKIRPESERNRNLVQMGVHGAENLRIVGIHPFGKRLAAC